MNTRSNLPWRVLLAAALAAAGGVQGQPGEVSPGAMSRQASTNGLELTRAFEVGLDVEVGIHAAGLGVTNAPIRKRLTARLGEAGFELAASKPEGRLKLAVETDSAGEHIVLRLQFIRPVSFQTESVVYAHEAVVWSRDFTGRYNNQSAAIPLIAEQLVDQFIEAHARANRDASLAGHITATDPKFQFVVLDIGSEAGLKEEKELLVRRKGQTVGALRVMRVEKDYAVANVINGTKAERLYEGDQVIPFR